MKITVGQLKKMIIREMHDAMEEDRDVLGAASRADLKRTQKPSGSGDPKDLNKQFGSGQVKSLLEYEGVMLLNKAVEGGLTADDIKQLKAALDQMDDEDIDNALGQLQQQVNESGEWSQQDEARFQQMLDMKQNDTLEFMELLHARTVAHGDTEAAKSLKAAMDHMKRLGLLSEKRSRRSNLRK